MRLHYAGFQEGASGFGWATCNRNLVTELEKLATVSMVNDGDAVFQPLINHDLDSATIERAKVNLGYAFFESALGPNAVANAAKYDILFVGSTWCLERLKEAGITNGKVLIQGVDQTIFSPQPPRKPDGQFRIFSGGKFEYRKGQDLVIAAFREFSKKHDDAHLVCSWFNPWPGLIFDSLNRMRLPPPLAADQMTAFDHLLTPMGTSRKRWTVLPQLGQSDLAKEMTNTDIGLFPNRCEGGTNLVLMEYASVGRRVIANAETGHRDICWAAIGFGIPAKIDQNHWAVQSVGDIVEKLEFAYEHRDTPTPAAERYKQQERPKWTWARAAETIYTEALACLARK